MNTLEFCRDWLNGKTAFALTTSGSTGKPKPMSISRNQMLSSAAMTIKKLGLTANDHALVCLDTAYIAGKMMLVRGFEADMAMTIVTPSSNPFKELSPDEHFDFTALIPLQLKKILEADEKGKKTLGGMKAILVGGGAVNEVLEEQLQPIKTPIYSTYGMTETVSHIALRKLNGPDKDRLFRTLEGVEIGQDERGCLTIKAAVTNHETIVTNDLVTLISENSFRWEGRIDNVINSGGIKINIEKLEDQIAGILSVLGLQTPLLIAGLNDVSLGEKVILVLEGPPLDKKIEQQLWARLRQDLAAYHVPKNLYYLPELIRTETGKIQRKMNLEELRKC